MQNERKKQIMLYLLFHLALLAAGGLLLLWHLLSRAAGVSGLYCPLHQLLHLYCPFCGGTRVMLSLLRLDLAGALAANPIILAGIPCFLFFDLLALVRLLRRESEPFRLPRALVPIVLAVFLLYGIVRNILLIGFHIDPTGDLLSHYL